MQKLKLQFNLVLRTLKKVVAKNQIFGVALTLLFVVGTITSFVIAPQTDAAIPKYINFQGKLTANSNGNNVANGTYAFEFKLYDAVSGGSLLWTETFDQPSGSCGKLTVTNGVFNAKLGSCASLSGVDFTGGSLYLTVNFAPTGTSYDGEMSPRKQLVSSAFAFVANGVSGDGVVNNAVQSTTALSTGRTSANPALQVDTNTASSVTGLKVTSAAAGGDLALTTISSGTNENLTIDAKGSGTVSINGTATGDILLGGGSLSTGCTVTNSTGAFACTAGGSFTTLGLSGAITGATGITSSGTIQFSSLTSNGPLYTSAGNGTLTTTAPTSGAIGYWSRTGTVLSQTTANDTISIANTTTTGADLGITNTGVYTGTGVFNLTANSATTGTLAAITGNGLTTGSLLSLSSNGTAAAASQTGLNISLQGTNGTSGITTYGAQIANTHSGTSSTNIAAYITASGGTDNYAVIVPSTGGNSGFGTTTPTNLSGVGAYFGNTQVNPVWVSANDPGKVTALVVQGNLGQAVQFIDQTGTAKADFGYYSSEIYIINRAGGGTRFYNNSTNVAMFLDSNANLGIGTSNSAPASRLEVKGATGQLSTLIGDAGYGTGYAGISVNGTFASNSYSILGDASNLMLNRPSGGDLFFREANSTQMILKTSTGNLGIGTTGPDKAVEINSSTGANLRLTYNDSNGSATNYVDLLTTSGGNLQVRPSSFIAEIGGGTTQTALRFLEPSGTGTDYAAIQSNANVTTSYTWTLPAADASGCIQSNGSGALSIAACAGADSLQASYNGGNSIETTSNTSVVVTETTTGAFTGDLLQLTVNQATGGTFSGDALQITMDGTDANAFTGNGIKIVVDKSQNTGYPILIQDDSANSIFTVNEDGQVILVGGTVGDITTADSSSGSSIVIQVGTTTGAVAGKGLGLYGGNTTNVSSSNAGSVDIHGGSALTAGIGGQVILDGGAGVGGNGGIYIGNTTASNISIGTANGTKTITLGATSADTINIGTAATNAKTISIGTGAVANTITIGSASATGVSITDNNWSINTSGVASFITGSVLGSQTFTTNNIADSGALTIKSATGANALTLDSGSTGDVNLGTGNNAKTIAIGTGTAGNTINIGTNNTTKDTINIGSALDDVAITGDQWSITNAGVLTVASCSGCGGGAFSGEVDDTTNDSLTFTSDDASAPAGTVNSIFRDNTGDLNINTISGKTLNLQIAGVDEYNLSSTALAMNSNNITGVGTAITGAAGMTITATSADLALVTATSGNITLAPASTGSVQITSGVTTGTTTSSGLSFVANSLTTGTGVRLSSTSLTSGILLDISSNGTAAAASQTGLNISLQGTNGTSGITTYGAQIANTHSGTTSTNVGLYLNASGGTTANYALVVPSGGGNVGIGDASPASLLTVGSGDLFQVNSSGQIGSQAAPTSDYLFHIAGTTGNDNSRIINITQANDAAEDSNVIFIDNTVSPGSGSRNVNNIRLSLSPTAATSGTQSISIAGIYNYVESANLSVGDGANNSYVYGTDNWVDASYTFNSSTFSDNVFIAGDHSYVDGSPILTSVTAGSTYNTYGQHATNYVSISGGNANLTSNAYGTYSASIGALTTTGTNAHYGGYFEASGTADDNYGIYVTASGATNNYALITNGGNVGIGDTTPASLLTVGSGDLFQVNSSGDITTAAAEALSITTGTTGNLTLDSGSTGDVNLGTGNNAKTIAIATGTAGNTINIGTNNTTKDTINIGSALDDVAITGDQWSITNAGVLTVASCSGCGGGAFSGEVDDTTNDSLTFTSDDASAPAGTVNSIFRDNTGDLNINTISGKTLNLQIAGVDEYNLSSTALAMNSNNITGVGTDITASAALTVASGGAGALTLDSASNTLVLAATDTTLQRTASGTYTMDFVDGSNTTLSVTNSGAGVANLIVEGSVNAAGSTPNSLYSFYVQKSGSFTNGTVGYVAELTKTGGTGATTGASTTVTYNATGTASFIAGGSFGVATSTAGAVTPVLTYASGIQGTVSNAASATTTTANGGYFSTTNSGTGTTHRGIFIEGGQFGGTLGTYNALDILSYSSSGTLTTLKGINMSGWVSGGTTSTSYGIYMDTSIDIGSTRYAIYSTSTSNSYMAGNFGLGDTSPASLFTVGNGDLFQVNSSGQIGSQQAPVSDYLFALAGTTGNDNSRVIDITQANDSAENSSVINIVNTVSPGNNTVTANNLNLSLSPTASVTSLNDQYYNGINNAVSAAGITIGVGAETFTFKGNNTSLVSSPTFNSATGSDDYNGYGDYISVTGSPTFTSVATSSNFNNYGQYILSNIASAGNANIVSNTYGQYVITTGDLTTTGNTAHYGSYFITQGTADINYGLYATVSGATTNYAAIITGGNSGFGTTAPDKALEINDASGNNLRLTYNDSNGSATNYADLLMGSSGDLTITASGSDTLITSNFVVGSATSATETLANTGFVYNGDDLFVAGMAGIEGGVYTDGSFVAGASTTISNGSITQSAGEALSISSGTTAALTLDSGSTGDVNLGTGNNAKTIAIATGTAGNTINIATDNTTKDTVNIGSALDDVAITGDQWSITNAGVLTVASCSGCGSGGSTAWDAIGDPAGNGAVNMGTTAQTLDWGATTTTDNLTVTSSATGLTSGSAFKVTSATTGSVSNGIVQLQASGAYTGTGGLLNLTANSTATGRGLAISTTALTTGKAIEITMGTALTRGNAINVSGASYDPGAFQTGSLVNLAFTDNSTSTSGTSVVNGLAVAPTITASGTGGTHETNGVLVSPTTTSCATGTCTVSGLKIDSIAEGADAVRFLSTGLKIGTGWDTGLEVGSGLAILGTGSSVTGKVTFMNSTNGNTASIQAGVTSSSYTWTMPTADAAGCIKSDGSGTLAIGSCGDTKVEIFDSNGTYTVPSDALMIIVEAIGGGGSGGGGAFGNIAQVAGGGGGGGGAYNLGTFTSSELGGANAALNVTRGAGGAAVNANVDGNSGGASCLSSSSSCGGTVYHRAYGGGGGSASANNTANGGGGGGGGGGALSNGNNAAAANRVGGTGGLPGPAAVTTSTDGLGGAGGATGAGSGATGGNSSWGGAGGGASSTNGAATIGTGGNSSRGGAGGGGGASCTISPCTTARVGQVGGNGGNGRFTGGTGGTAPGGTGGAGTSSHANSAIGGGGGGGGGSNQAASGVPGGGGAGGVPGGGGGGGGTNINNTAGTTGGAGGAGGNGRVRISTLRGAGADLAEIYGTYDPDLKAGDVVAINPLMKSGVQKTDKPYDSNVVGVISTDPGLVIGNIDGDPEARPVMVALAGRVPVKVSLENGPINPGDQLTASSIPGVAMKATKAGVIIGQALTKFDPQELDLGDSKYPTGYVVMFIKNSHGNGSKLSSIIPGLELDIGSSQPPDGVDPPISILPPAEIGKTALTYFVSTKDELIDSVDVSEILADRISAALQIITPELITDTARVNVLTSSSGDDLAVELSQEGKLIIRMPRSPDESSEDNSVDIAISFDPTGNAFFSGKVIASALQVGSIMNLEEFALGLQNEISVQQTTLEDLVVRLTALENPNSLDLNNSIISSSLSVSGMVTASSGLAVDWVSSIGSSISFMNDIELIGRPYFNADSAGFAVIHPGERFVDVVFEQEYLDQPIVNASITRDADPAVLGETDPSILSQLQAIQEANDEILFNEGYQFIVTRKNTAGFRIYLNKPAESEITFSWIALAVKNAKLFSNQITPAPDPLENNTPDPEVFDDPLVGTIVGNGGTSDGDPLLPEPDTNPPPEETPPEPDTNPPPTDPVP